MSLGTLPTLLLIPPLNLFPLAALGVALRRPALFWAASAGIALLSLPIVSGALLAALRNHATGPPPQAIVILSADQQETLLGSAATFTTGPATLEREAAGAALARRTGLPVLVSGGRLHDVSPTLAQQMTTGLAQDFGVAVRWQEARSLNTWQNATETATLLLPAGITSIYLVTHGWHMRRALIAFHAAGLAVTSAPAADPAWPLPMAAAFVPSLRGLVESETAMHEWFGCAVYAIRAALAHHGKG